ncbi:General transcription factor 3C polypeptide 2 [Frankliniella fusca]|uniref:General transcription factor 3C polypeptide 2 n=1 Tax=Frankliniella fusca TaxID=407009 RepID=A0AAE1H421_9NEOP|nr:General transcription factor 3C polypeptide 2 [Frankliniella fusca]
MPGGRRSLVKEEVEVVQCAVCKEEMSSRDFPSHNINSHNMLAWVEGTMPADVSDEKYILRMLQKALKSKKRKVLTCEICGEEKKSALGFYSHKQVCGKSDEEIEQFKVACEICGKSVLPCSMKSHMMIHQRQTAQDDIDQILESPTSASPGTSQSENSVKRNKRAAATRAKSRMMDFLSDEVSSLPKDPKPLKKLYSDMGAHGWESSPRLLETWEGFLSLTGSIMCVYSDCQYRADSIDSIKGHLSECEYLKEHNMKYLCNVCLFQDNEESEIVQHVLTEHESKESILSDAQPSSEEDSTSETEVQSSPAVKRQNRQSIRPKPPGQQRAFNKMKFLQNTVTSVAKDLEIYNAALQWTFDFRLANYSENVFPDLVPLKREWSPLREHFDCYVPRETQSIPFEFRSPSQSTSIAACRLSIFEGQIIDGVSTFFTGGPVWAMEWCPIPMHACLSDDSPPSDYLAVSTHHTMDDTFCVPKCYAFPNIIQFWECGNLSCQSVHQPPKLALALAHEYGTIWSMSWCPSGAYDVNCSDSTCEKSWKRVGLLAAACSSGNVQVFSIPFPNQLVCHLNEITFPIYKAKPSLTLITNFTEPSQCTRVTWYPGSGHGLIAGGFCNGMVALWDLQTLPSLLWDAEHNTLKPFQCFQAHLTVISALSFNPEHDGRFFMTGSHDRGIKFWDMEDLSAPITHHRRGFVTDGVWLNLWMSSITSYDDAFQHEHTNSTLHPVRDYGYKPYPLLTQNSVAWCLSYNEWINATAQGSEAGEVVVSFSSQLMRGLDNEKNSIEKRIMASYTLLKKLISGNDDTRQLGEVVTWKPEPKSNKNKGKKPVKSSKGKGKRNAKNMESEQGTEETAQALLVDRNPKSYADIEKNYGLCVCDVVKASSNKNKLPEEAKSRVRISGKMHPTCSDFYPITSINKISSQAYNFMTRIFLNVSIPRTLELFVQSLMTSALAVTNAKNARTLSPSHMKQCIISDHRFHFLKDLVRSLPDVNSYDEDGASSASVTTPVSEETLGSFTGRRFRTNPEKQETPPREDKDSEDSESTDSEKEASNIHIEENTSDFVIDEDYGS